MTHLFARRRRDADFARRLDELDAVLHDRLDRALAELNLTRRYIASIGRTADYRLYAVAARRNPREKR